MLLDMSPAFNQQSGRACSLHAVKMTVLMFLGALISTSMWAEWWLPPAGWPTWFWWQWDACCAISVLVWHPLLALRVNQTSPNDQNCQNKDNNNPWPVYGERRIKFNKINWIPHILPPILNQCSTTTNTDTLGGESKRNVQAAVFIRTEIYV